MEKRKMRCSIRGSMAMIEFSNERLEEILHKETVKKEDLTTILRSIYTRYMRLYEKYFADIDALDDDGIAELRKYHEETQSLVKHYYMDIPMDICLGIREFEDKYSANLLGQDWHKYLFDAYKDFREKNKGRIKSDEKLKEEFTKQALDAFYDAMGYILREGFGTGSQTVNHVISGITGLLFGKEKK